MATTTAWSQATVETFATLPSAEGTENLCEAADGSIYVTLINANQLLKVTPDGAVSEFATTPSMAHLLGVACGDDIFVTTAFAKTFRKPNPDGGRPIFDFSDVESHVLVFDSDGNQIADLPGQTGQAFNGITSGGDGTFFIADSNAATVWRVDLASSEIEAWLTDDRLAPPPPGQGFPIGANGIAVHDGWVYVSSTGGTAVYRVQIGADGSASGGLVAIEEDLQYDDISVAPDGSVYMLARTTLNRVSPDGTVTAIAEDIQGGPATMVSADGAWVYWPTRGGDAPQRLLRVAIP